MVQILLLPKEEEPEEPAVPRGPGVPVMDGSLH